MDLPTYTNIWRIEKRLYKLYDLRLPTPLPIVWIGVFVGVLAPWWVLLYLVGVPFETPWHVVYLVPPGIVTWLSTRPVIESKRLTELLQSQLRYLTEPRAWCRMAPTGEPDEIGFTARVWRTAPHAAPLVRKARHAAAAKATPAKTTVPEKTVAPRKSRGEGAEPWAPERAVPARAGSKSSGGDALGTVRPVVAAAAAAAGPVTESAAPVRWARASAAAKATAGAEPVFSLPESPDRQASARPAVVPALDAASSRPSTVRALEAVPTGPDAVPAGPSAGPGTDLGAVSAEDSAVPAVAAEAAAPVPPIGTEALRKLRRLAASAEVPAVRRGQNETAVNGGPDGPVATDGHLPAASMSAATPTPESVRAPEAKKVWPAEEPLRAVEEPTRAGEGSSGAVEDSPRVVEEPPRVVEEVAGAAEPPYAAPVPLSIRTVPSDAVPAPLPLPPTALSHPSASSSAPRGGDEPRIRRVESVVGRDPSGGWRRMAQVVVGGGGSRTDRMEIDEARARTVLTASRRILVLGCTGGAGQTTTALMLGHTLAGYREDRVLAVDANTGDNTLSTRILVESPETLGSLLAHSDGVNGYLAMRGYTSLCESCLEVVGAETGPGAAQRLADRALLDGWRRTLAVLDQHYRLTVIDPAAALAARLLQYADQLVLVAPASEDAPDAVAMTYEWLDGHGSSDLRRRAVMVINGVSRRSLPDVEQAEAVARGRCRAIVRVPWEDELAPGRPGPVELGHLREGGRRAYVALAGVVASGLAANQPKQEVAR